MWGQGDFKMQVEYAGLVAAAEELQNLAGETWADEAMVATKSRMGELRYIMTRRGVEIPS